MSTPTTQPAGRRITISGYSLYVRELGSEGPLIPPRLLVHNALSSSKIWARAMPLLAHHTRCVAPDLPGHGDSADLARDAPVPDMPHVLVDIAEECGMPMFDLIGASRGGGFALGLAARFPQRVRRLVLVGATGMITTHSNHKLADEDEKAVLRHLKVRATPKNSGARALLTSFERDMDVGLQDDSVSQRHAMIFVDEAGASLLDMASTNGSFLNGKRASSVELALGDLVRIGETRIEVRG